MSLPVSPPARRVFAAIVFGGGAPSFDWQRTTETRRGSRSVPLLREPLLLVAVGVIRMVQEDFDAEKTWSYRRDTHRSAALMILVSVFLSQSRFLLPSRCLLPNLRTEMHGGARIRQWRAVPADERSPASLVVATRIRSGRTARGDATPVQHTPGTSAVVDLCSRRRCVNSNPL